MWRSALNYRRPMIDTSDLFQVEVYPDRQREIEYERLVGLDEYKERLVKEVLLLVDPASLRVWSKKHHSQEIAVLSYFATRPPLFILAGDVGTGKTALARSFGTEVAKKLKVQVQLYSLSLNARGTGAVGEMTRLISAAFQQVREAVSGSQDGKRRAGRGVILLLDEADALAQSRESGQMHHEDRAGVNALIRGIDSCAADHLPVAVIMCTNRLDAIDPAVYRRAAAVFRFDRPNLEQRLFVLKSALEGTGISDEHLAELAEVTGAHDGRKYGFTYSDLTQRLIPSLVLDAFPDRPLNGRRAIEIAASTVPTPPFREKAIN